MKLTKLLIVVLICGMFAGCKVGPNYHRPLVQTPPTYRDLQANTQLQAQAASYADLPWWQVFQDPKLQELIRTALKQNYDLQLATERINAARAQLAITRSNLFPQVQGNGNFSGGKESNFQSKFNFLTLAADATFQVDLFGRLRRATEAARAQLLATDAARQTVILTLVSDVASDYFALLELDLQLQITNETVKTQIDSVKLTTLRLQHGVATKLDVLQAQQVLDTANAAVPDLERQIAQEENLLFKVVDFGAERLDRFVIVLLLGFLHLVLEFAYLAVGLELGFIAADCLHEFLRIPRWSALALGWHSLPSCANATIGTVAKIVTAIKSLRLI